jgi:CDP-diglyceride synthetase
VKDSGQLLPEFGGALDIVDSLFLAMPVGWGLLAALQG